MFSIIQPLYPHPKYLFEFGPQRIRGLFCVSVVRDQTQSTFKKGLRFFNFELE